MSTDVFLRSLENTHEDGHFGLIIFEIQQVALDFRKNVQCTLVVEHCVHK